MLKIYKTKGIILKRINLGEADRIFTIYTAKYGKVKALAKGVRKILSKLGGHLELFNLVDLSIVEGRNLGTITACQIVQSFRNIKKDLKKTSLAYYLAGLTDKLTLEKQKDYRIYKLLEEIFQILNRKTVQDSKRLYLLVYAFELQFLSLLGYSPELKKCVVCGKVIKPREIYFNIPEGLVCPNCKKPKILKVNSETVKLLRLLKEKDFNLVLKLKLEKRILREVRNIIKSFIKYILEKELKARDFIKKVERL